MKNCNRAVNSFCRDDGVNLLTLHKICAHSTIDFERLE